MLRRQSTVTKTEDNHEITWPPVGAEANAPEPSPPSSTISPEHEADTTAQQQPHLLASNSVLSSDSEDSGPVHEICLPDKTTVKATTGETNNRELDPEEEEFVTRGGSSIVSPFGKVLAGPLWDVVDGGLLSVDVDFEDCTKGGLDLDVSGHYSRRDQFRLSVEGLVLDPPV